MSFTPPAGVRRAEFAISGEVDLTLVVVTVVVSVSPFLAQYNNSRKLRPTHRPIDLPRTNPVWPRTQGFARSTEPRGPKT